ncbi:EF-hand calcium-binding domain-containing protein 14-like isoform X2 [Littorina saxatilis]
MNGTIDYSALDNEQLIKLDQGSRASVQFKPSKKMKKRRQLDALVSNGKKLPRRKQSGHELLRSNDSESSEVEEFSVLEGQKWGKRWPNQGCCSTCYTLTCVLVVASCLLACATLIWMHLELKRNFNELKDRMEQVENKNAGTPEEFEALKMKLMSVNSSVAEIRSGKYGLDALNTSIVQIKKQITSLQATTSKLQQSDQSTDSTDKEHNALADIVATIGSDLNTAQSGITSVKAKQTEFASQLEALGNRLTAVENPGGREGGASVAPASTDVQKLLTQINATFTQSISKVVTDVNKLQTHMDAVDKFTQTMQDQMRNLTMQVSNVTQAHSQWQGSNSKVTDARAEDEPTQPVSTGALHELQGRMDHLQDSLEKIQTDHSNLTQAVDTSTDTAALANVMQKLKEDQGDFLLFRTEVFHDITSLNTSMATVNKSVGSLNKDVEDLFAKMGMAMTEISNVTSVVEGLTNFLQSQKESKTANAAAEGAGSKAEEKGGVTDNAQTSKTTLPESKQTTTAHQEQLSKSTTTPQSKKSG